MSDFRFHDIVIESSEMIGPQGEYHSAVCKTCSTKHKVFRDEFELGNLFNLDGSNVNPLDRADNYKEILKYVAEMRAWNCCHEGAEPLDGFPEPPENSRLNFEQ